MDTVMIIVSSLFFVSGAGIGITTCLAFLNATGKLDPVKMGIRFGISNVFLLASIAARLLAIL